MQRQLHTHHNNRCPGPVGHRWLASHQHHSIAQSFRQKPKRPLLSATQQSLVQTETNAINRGTAVVTKPPTNNAVDAQLEAVEEPQQQTQKQFDWFKAWYPLAVLTDLDPDVPSHAKLLGMNLAVWYDKKASKWRAFQDRCPHRLAPLSEGRIDSKTGNLYCNYHGWQFDGSGTCTDIPQLPKGQPINSKRSCVVGYPTCEREGLLWVWPDASPTAAAESSDPQNWPGLAPEFDNPSYKAVGNGAWYFRDIPACWLAVKENAFNDVSHDTVLHHGANPFTGRDSAAPIDMKLIEMTPTGYTVREANGRFEDTARFPCGSKRDGMFKGVAYIVPTGVGTCRQFHAFVLVDKPMTQQQQKQGSTASPSNSSSPSSQTAKMSPKWGLKIALLLNAIKPLWASHMKSHMLVDADIAMQSRIDINRAVDDRVYMPAAIDAGPSAFMKWLREFGDNGPPVAKINNPFLGVTPAEVLPSNRRQLLDRYHSHTAQCKACRTAQRQFKVLQQIVAVAALMAGSAAVGVLGLLLFGALPAAQTGSPAAGVVAAGWLALGAAVSGLVWAGLGQIVQRFEFIDYDKQHVSKM